MLWEHEPLASVSKASLSSPTFFMSLLIAQSLHHSTARTNSVFSAGVTQT